MHAGVQTRVMHRSWADLAAFCENLQAWYEKILIPYLRSTISHKHLTDSAESSSFCKSRQMLVCLSCKPCQKPPSSSRIVQCWSLNLGHAQGVG